MSCLNIYIVICNGPQPKSNSNKYQALRKGIERFPIALIALLNLVGEALNELMNYMCLLGLNDPPTIDVARSWSVGGAWFCVHLVDKDCFDSNTLLDFHFHCFIYG